MTRSLLALGYSLAVGGLWSLGLVAAIWHPSRLRWRQWAIVAFAMLLLSRIVATTFIAADIITSDGTWHARSLLQQLLEVFQVLGITLIIAALVSSRRRPAPPLTTPGPSPSQQSLPRDR